MQKLVICIMMLAFSFSSFCQSTTTRDQYLSRAKSQKTTALVLIIGGSSLLVIGAGISLGEALNSPTEYSNTGDIIMAIGGAAMIGSIPLFISSKKNKKKGLALTINRIMIPQQNSIRYRLSYIPAVSLKLQL